MAPSRTDNHNSRFGASEDPDALPLLTRDNNRMVPVGLGLFGVIDLAGDEEVITSSNSGRGVSSPQQMDDNFLACSTPLTQSIEEFSVFSKVGARNMRENQLLRETLMAAQKMKDDCIKTPKMRSLNKNGNFDNNFEAHQNGVQNGNEQMRNVLDISFRDDIFAPYARRRAEQARQEKEEREAAERRALNRESYLICIILGFVLFHLFNYLLPLNVYWFIAAIHVVYFGINFLAKRTLPFFLVTAFIVFLGFYTDAKFSLFSNDSD